MRRPTAPPRAASQRKRPAVEGLEARHLLTAFNVTNGSDSGAGSLRAAIEAANAQPGGDLILIDPTAPTVTLTSGQLDVTGDLTILGAPELATTSIRRSDAVGTADFRLFAVAAGATLRLEHVTLTNGRAAAGAAIQNAGTLILIEAALRSNVATADGGGVDNNGILIGSLVRFETNAAVNGGAVRNGGGAFASFEKTTFDGNTGTSGAGILNAGTLTINTSTISGNSSTHDGAGLFNGGTATLLNSTISGNTSGQRGGGVFNGPGATLALQSATVAGNAAAVSGGGIRNETGATTTLTNTIVADSTGGGDLAGPGTFAGSHVLVEDGSGGIAGTLAVDPKLGPLADNGGATRTRALLAGSPALNAGDQTALPTDTSFDQRGAGYFRVQDGQVDLGALEVGDPVPTVAALDATTPNGSYGVGSVLDITVRFTEAVTVTGTPGLLLNTGGTAAYLSGSGTTTLTFRTTVAAGQTAADLDAASATALSLNGGTIRDATGNDALLALPDPGAINSLGRNTVISVDGVKPTILSVGATTPDGTYGTGAVITLTVRFSEPVVVVTPGAVALALNSGGTAAYQSGSGTDTLTFVTTVAAGQTAADLDAASAAALTAPAGAIVDAATSNPNAATLTVPVSPAAGALASSRAIVINTTPTPPPDTTAPSVVAFRVLYGNGRSLDLAGVSRVLPWKITGIQVVFSEPIAAGSAASLGGLSAASLAGLGTTTLTWALAGITNARVAATLAGTGAAALADASGNHLGGGSGFARSFNVLVGDSSGNGKVTQADANRITKGLRKPFDPFLDLNGDGRLTKADARIATKAIGTKLGVTTKPRPR